LAQVTGLDPTKQALMTWGSALDWFGHASSGCLDLQQPMILPMEPLKGRRVRPQGMRSQKGPPNASSPAAEAKEGRARGSETGRQDWNSARRAQVRGGTLTDKD